MAKEICTVCGREIDSRGLSGHMKTHIPDEGDGTNSGDISYPSQGVPTHPEGGESTDEIGTQGKPVKKTVKKAANKTVAIKPASNPASSPDTRGQRNSGSKNTAHPKDSGAHKHEWKGLFRD